MGIVVSCANLATIYHNTKYSGGKVVNYLHISRKCSGCVRDVFGMHLERVRHLTICRTMNFLACLKSATQPFNVLLASKHPLITELADKLRQKYPFLPTISPYPTMRLETKPVLEPHVKQGGITALRLNMFNCQRKSWLFRMIILLL